MNKRIICLLALLALMLSGCASPAKSHKLQVVAAIFPEYDWVRQIAAGDDSLELTLLVDDGVDPHSFQPSVKDMVTVSQSDLLIFGGGESDEWLEDALGEEGGSHRQVIRLLPLLGANAHQAEVVEGMQVWEEEDETDEHVWLSLRNAALFCTAIADSLCTLNPGKAALYRANLATYLAQLQALDEAYRQTVSAGKQNTIVVCDRFPFRYLVEDYALGYYAAFPGCSAETGASFETVVFLAGRVKALELNALLVTESSDGRLAHTVADNSDRRNVAVLTLNSMQAVSAEEAKSSSYLSIMEQNRLVLEQALG